MRKKHVTIDFVRCRADACARLSGGCAAALHCTHGLLEQEDDGEPPVLLSQTMCVGCGLCVKGCPYGAVKLA